MSEIDLPLWCSESDSADPIAALFKRKFGDPPPATPTHFIAWLRDTQGYVPVGYAHVETFGDIGLLGGACTDGARLRQAPAALRDAVAARGGVYRHLLRHVFARCGGRFAAVFGYCGDARAWDIGIDCGFVATEFPRLRVYFPEPLHATLARALIAKAAAIGPF